MVDWVSDGFNSGSEERANNTVKYLNAASEYYYWMATVDSTLIDINSYVKADPWSDISREAQSDYTDAINKRNAAKTKYQQAKQQIDQ